MKAWRVHDFGEPEDTFVLEEVAEPTPELLAGLGMDLGGWVEQGDQARGARPDWAIMRMSTAALALPDVTMSRGTYPVPVRRPYISGQEGVGVVMEASADRRHLIGKRVTAVTIQRLRRLLHPGGSGELDVVDSTIVTNGQEGGNQSIGAGIFIAPTGTPDVNATLTNLQILNNTNGIRVDTSGATGGAVQVTVRETVVQNSAAQGVSIVSGGGTLDQVMLDRVSIVNGKAGVVANGATAAVFISNSIVTGNNRGFTILNSGEISSYGNNNVVGNATDGLEFLTPIGTH